MDQAGLFENTDPHKMVRTTDPETSRAAARKVQSGELKKFVFARIAETKMVGITMAEVAERNPQHSINTVSPRGKPLEEEGLIFYMGDRRDGSRIMRDAKLDPGYRVCSKCLGVLAKFYDYKCQSAKCKK